MGPIVPPTRGENPVPPAPLVSSWRALADAGEPVAVVRVRNLQAALPVGRDAWGRPGILQPVLLSSEISFAQPFSSSSTTTTTTTTTTSSSADTDELDAGTAHYGNLSKTLLSTLEQWDRDNTKPGSAAAAAAEVPPPRTADVFELLWVRMTGRVVDGSRTALPPEQLPFLDAARLRALSLTVSLPKASLLGAGVSLTTTASYRGGDNSRENNPLRSYSRSLRLSGLRVPTLVGVNENERAARQMLVADVQIERFDVADDVHSELEKLVVETMESSSFKTLEALASRVAERILSDFRVGDDPRPMRERGWQVRVCLEKPIAVPFAECPAVEVRMGMGTGP
ncbi:hypothetical protein AAE478_000125 [Parahypoxylon ruwenzoriense]